jgi:hypothetical protein
MTDCDDVRLRRVLGHALDDTARTHAASCTRCIADATPHARLAAALATAPEPAPPPSLHARTIARVAGLLEARRHRAGITAAVRAVAVALLPLPVVVLIDAWVLHAIYRALASVLPASLSFYLVVNHAALLALLCGATYAAIALLAAHQRRAAPEVLHG